MSKDESIFRTYTAQTEPGSDGRGPAKVLTPDEIIPTSDVQLVDEHLGFYLAHRMRKTAGKQADHMVQVARQSQLDAFRAEQSMKMYNDLAAESAKYMNDLCCFRDSCADSIHPDAAARIAQVVDRGLEIQQKLPEAGVRLFLQRYALG